MEALILGLVLSTPASLGSLEPSNYRSPSSSSSTTSEYSFKFDEQNYNQYSQDYNSYGSASSNAAPLSPQYLPPQSSNKIQSSKEEQKKISVPSIEYLPPLFGPNNNNLLLVTSTSAAPHVAPGDRQIINSNSPNYNNNRGDDKPSSINYLPPVVGFGGEAEEPPVKYGFEYRVKDEFGNDFAHKESRDGASIKGVYTVLLPDGRKQIVHYEANENGFNPTISYEETNPFPPLPKPKNSPNFNGYPASRSSNDNRGLY